MKRSLFRLHIICIALTTVMALSTVAEAQSQVFNYRIEYFPIANGTSVHEVAEVSDGNTSRIVAVGAFRPNPNVGNLWHGYFYDLVDGFTDIHSMFGLDDTWSTSCRGISANGIVVGSIRLLAGKNRAFWFDRFAANPELNILDEDGRFPELAAHVGNFAVTPRRVNAGGDIVITVTPDGPSHYIVNPFSGELISIDVYGQGINDSRMVVGTNSSGQTVRYDASNDITEVFPDLEYPADINSGGQFCGSTDVYYRRNKFNRYAFRYGNQIDWLSDPIEVGLGGADSLNDDSDVVFRESSSDTAWFYHNLLDESFDLKTLVADPYFASAALTGSCFISNRNYALPVPAPVVSGPAYGADGTARIFFLIPDDTTPSPGISVTPNNGLVTTEAGGIATFDVVLETQPAADVTIGINSSDTTEGTVDVAGLTFTTANWDTAQTVTVTGVDDPDLDGDTAYMIISAAAVSSDPDYDGLDADDVGVTNQDDETPPGGGTETYSSEDTPLDIPDNNSSGVSSIIVVGDDFQIANLTVTLDISHPRPSDLTVYLVGPDNTQVQLTNFSGDTNVSAFNGTSTIGLWILEVYDTRKKKIGTLNGWSMTVETQ